MTVACAPFIDQPPLQTGDAAAASKRPMRQTKEQRKAYLRTRAVDMARSEKYRDWEQIEFALCFDEGFLEARGWLDSRARRDWLNRLCREAKDAQANAAQS
jgi:hypothetical protein